jgi:prolyl-tRNA editing enzyme YbaK/EbsC (Cys-tRNA(Pro) deacylase)
VTAAESAGLSIEVIEFPDGTRTAVDAAAAVGCDVAQIVKSMIFTTGDRLVLALTSGIHQVDAGLLAVAFDVERCARADADHVRSHTGFAIGGVAPIGHLSPIDAVIDPHLLTFDTVWAAAGSPSHVFGLPPAVVQRIAGARQARFTRGHPI